MKLKIGRVRNRQKEEERNVARERLTDGKREKQKEKGVCREGEVQAERKTEYIKKERGRGSKRKAITCLKKYDNKKNVTLRRNIVVQFLPDLKLHSTVWQPYIESK